MAEWSKTYARAKLPSGEWDINNPSRPTTLAKEIEAAITPGVSFKVYCEGAECKVIFPAGKPSAADLAAMDAAYTAHTTDHSPVPPDLSNTVEGSTGGNVALISLLKVLASRGSIIDKTTP
jgi:hypothetical protein